MLKHLLTTLLLFFSLLSQGQIRMFSKAGGGLNDEPNDVLKLTSGKIISTGYYNQIAFFGPTTLAFSGNDDAFIASQDQSGTFEWAISLSGASSERGIALAEDNAGFIYVAGYYRGTANMGSFSLTSTDNTQDVFVAKLNASGVVQWLRGYGGSALETLTGMVFSSNNTLHLVGQFNGTTTLGTNSFVSAPLQTSGTQGIDAFTATLDLDGNVQSAVHLSSPDNDITSEIAVTATGRTYLTLNGSGTLQVGGQSNNMGNSSYGALISLNPNGTQSFVKKFTASFIDLRAIDFLNNILVVGGNFSGGLSSDVSGFTGIPAQYANSIFGVVLSPEGVHQANFSESSASEVSLNDLSITPNGKVWIAGSFACTLTSIADDLGAGKFNNVGEIDAFTALYNTTSNNNRRFAQYYGGTQEDQFYAVSAHQSGHPAFTGSFENRLYLQIPTGTYEDGTASQSVSGLAICGSNLYGDFIYDQTNGSRDVFTTTLLDTLAPVFDIYKRTQCEGSVIEPQFNYPNDTLLICSPTFINNHILNLSAGFNLYTNACLPSGTASSTGWYVATHTTLDGCRTFTDSLYVILGDTQYEPTLTSAAIGEAYDVYQSDSNCPVNISLGPGQSATVTGSTFNALDEISWSNDTGILSSGSNTFQVSDPGTYTYTVVNQFGCDYNTCFNVYEYAITTEGVTISTPENTDVEVTFEPAAAGLMGDTLMTCTNSPITISVQALDAQGNEIDYPIPAYAHWSITGQYVVFPLMMQGESVPEYSYNTHTMIFRATASGWVHIEVEFLLPPGNTNVVATLEWDIYVVQNVNNLPQLSVVWDASTDGICPGDTVTLSYDVFPANFPYQVTIPSGTAIGQGTDFVQFNAPGSVNIAMNYTDTITGCSINSSTSRSVAFKEAPEIAMFPEDGRKCPDDSVLIEAEAGISVEWIGPQGDAISNDFSIQVVTPGDYYYNLVDLDGCSLLSETVEIRNIQAVIYDSIITENICGGDPALIRLASDTNLIYNWLAPLSGSDTLKYISQPGTYSVRVELCSNVDTLTFTVEEGIATTQLEIVSVPPSLCQGGTITLSANPLADTIVWQPYNLTGPVITVDQPAQVIVTLSDTVGCVLNDTLLVNMNPNPPTPDSLFPGSVCEGTELVLSTNVPYPFVWHELPDTTEIGAGYTLSYNLTNSGQIVGGYAYNPLSGCRSSWVEQTLTLLTPVSIAPITDAVVFCPGDTVLISPASVPGIDNGLWTGPNQYQAISNDLFFPDIASSAAGTYYYTPIPAAGFCSYDFDTLQLILRTLEAPVLSFTDSICAGEALTFSVSQLNDYNYLWNGPAQFISTELSNVINNAQVANSGNYTLTSRDSNCSRIDTIPLFVSAIPPATPLIGYPETICEGDTLFLFNADSANTGGAELTWIGSPAFEPNGPNSVYIPNFTDSLNATFGLQYNINQCFSAVSLADVTVLPVPGFGFTGELKFCEGDVYFLDGPPGMVAYLWYDGSTGSSITISETDTVSLVVTSENGCDAWAETIVEEVDCDLDDTPNTFSPNGDGINDKLEFTVEGGKVYSALIYNRWGKLMKEIGPNISFWDGTDSNGNEVPDGTYFYILSVEMINGTQDKLQGFVALFR